MPFRDCMNAPYLVNYPPVQALATHSSKNPQEGRPAWHSIERFPSSRIYFCHSRSRVALPIRRRPSLTRMTRVPLPEALRALRERLRVAQALSRVRPALPLERLRLAVAGEVEVHRYQAGLLPWVALRTRVELQLWVARRAAPLLPSPVAHHLSVVQRARVVFRQRAEGARRVPVALFLRAESMQPAVPPRVDP